MATHRSTLAWKISWTEKPGGLQSTGMQIVRHERVTEHSLTQTYIKVTILYEVHNFKNTKGKEREKTLKYLTENKLSIKGQNKTIRNAMLKMPIKFTAKNLFLIKLIFKE